jgi:hypothetical protein
MKKILETYYNFADSVLVDIHIELIFNDTIKLGNTISLTLYVYDTYTKGKVQKLIKLKLYGANCFYLSDKGTGGGAIIGAAVEANENGYVIDFDPIVAYDESDNEVFSISENSAFQVQFKKYKVEIIKG